MKFKKVIVNLLPFDQKLSGTGYFFFRLFKEVLRLDSLNYYELHLSCNIDVFSCFESAPNVKFIYHNLPKSKVARVIYEQLIFPFKIRGDIFFSPSVAIPFVFQFSVKNYITVIHDVVPFIFKKYSLLQQIYVKLITRICAYRSDIIITVSENSKEDIIKYLKVDEGKIFIIYNFLNEYRSLPVGEHLRENFFITVSTVQPGKNLLRLIESFHLFYVQNPDYKLYIVGNLGWNYKDIISLVDQYKMKENILFLGYVTDESLEKLYCSARALLYVSLYEGFGIPPLEAMSYNCPIVVSNVSSLPEVVGEAGIYVNPYDINDILNGINEVINIDLVYYRIKSTIQCKKFDGYVEAKKFLELIKKN